MKKNESGRSMVEMLGVLAIIGVLSVGGIAGYTMAMNRYRANEVVDMANKYAVIAYSAYMTSKMMNNGTADANAIPSFASTGLFGSNSSVNGTKIGPADVDEDYVRITLTFNNEKICQATATSLGAVISSSSTPKGTSSIPVPMDDSEPAPKSTVSQANCGSNGGTIEAVFKQS
ncbi:MAG: hypothetical protein IKZ02_06440 [Alphaproteobacteria bacterium]|nr:hypothetical protein [Alphaproteobacteria bacterium]